MESALREQIEPMTAADLDAVASLERTLYVHPWTRGNFADSLQSGYVMQVLRRGDELVGYFVLMIGVDEGHLLNISVARPWQRHGYGGRLLERAGALCRARGAHSLFLEVRPSNLPAQSLYRRRGFRQVGLRPGYYPKGDVDVTRREDAFVLVLDL